MRGDRVRPRPCLRPDRPRPPHAAAPHHANGTDTRRRVGLAREPNARCLHDKLIKPMKWSESPMSLASLAIGMAIFGLFYALVVGCEHL